MIRMTMLSIAGHAFAALVMLFLSWYQPVPKITRGQVVKVKVYSGGGGGAAAGMPAATLKPTPAVAAESKKTPPPIVLTPQPTPRPAEKTIIRPKKSPTPEATKTPASTKKAATPTPKKPTPSPRATATPRVTPKATGTPGAETKKTPSPSGTPKPGPTPAATPKGEAPGSATAAPLVIGPDKTATAGPGIPGLPPIPGGNTGDGSPLSGYDYYRAWALYKIQPNFNIPRYLKAEGITCLVHFTVLRDGRIVNIRVLRSTNDPILDGLAVRALEATASLPPLPDTFKEDQVELNVLFDYSPSVEQGGSVNP